MAYQLNKAMFALRRDRPWEAFERLGRMERAWKAHLIESGKRVKADETIQTILDSAISIARTQFQSRVRGLGISGDNNRGGGDGGPSVDTTS